MADEEGKSKVAAEEIEDSTVSLVKKSLNNVNLNTSMDIREESEEMTVRKQLNRGGASERNINMSDHDHSAAFSDDSSRQTLIGESDKLLTNAERSLGATRSLSIDFE